MRIGALRIGLLSVFGIKGILCIKNVEFKEGVAGVEQILRI